MYPVSNCFRSVGLLPTLAMALATPCAAATLYVAPNGSDSNSGTQAAPFRQIRKAVTIASAGDTVQIADGDYLGFDVRDKHGTAQAPITLLAPGRNARILTTTDRRDNRDTIFVTFSSYVILDGLRTSDANRAGVRIDTSPHITVRNGVFLRGGTWGIFTDYSDDLLLENNECAFSGAEHGIYVSNSGDRPVIRFNVLHDNRASGIQINADPAQIDPDLGTTGDGITENALVEGNIAYNNGTSGGAAINLASVRASRIVNNLLYNNRAGGITGWDDGDGNEWGSKNNLIAYNTVHFRATEGRWCVSLKNGSTGNLVENNILSGGARGGIEIDSDSPVTSDYNLLRRAGTTTVATNEDIGTFYTLTAWQSVSGNDLHSVAGEAQFVSPDTAPFDFHLRTTSPVLNRGLNIAEVNRDLEGRVRPQFGRPDPGCYELQASISGTVALQEASASGKAFTFVFRTGGIDLFTRTATAGAAGQFTLTDIPEGMYAVWVKGSQWLAQVVPLAVDSVEESGLNVALRGGDANNDNSADALDLAVLITAFNATQGEPLYNPDADFNGDNSVDALDLALLITNFNQEGDL